MLLTLLACLRPGPAAPLADRVSVVARMADGQLVGLLVELDEPRVEPEVSYAASPLLISAEGAWILGPAGAVSALDGAWAPPPDRGPVHLDGPRAGFTLEVRDGVLRLAPPDPDLRYPLLRGVTELVAVRWFSENRLPPNLRALAFDRYKAALALRNDPGGFEFDGRLHEWAKAEGIVVDRELFVQAGLENWSGDRDAGFGVIRRDLGLAVRLRDDEVRYGEDAVTLEADGERMRFLVQPAGLCPAQDGPWACAFASAVSFGTGLEVSGSLPVERVTFEDVDSDGTTVLSTAPNLAILRHLP